MDDKFVYIGIDIGGTSTRIGLFGESIDFQDEVTFPTLQDYSKALKNMFSKIVDLVENKNLNSIGISIAGRLDEQSTRLLGSPNLENWIEKPLKNDLKEHFDAEVKMINDASAAAVAEANVGGAQLSDRFLYINWGTGIGGKAIESANGKLKIFNMEPGHQIIQWDGKKCGCGQNGCLEAFIGGKYLDEKYGESTSFDEAEYNEIARLMTHGIINTLHHFPTDLIIFGGGFISNNENIIDLMGVNLNHYTGEFYRPEIKLSDLGDKSGIFGAVSLFSVDIIST